MNESTLKYILLGAAAWVAYRYYNGLSIVPSLTATGSATAGGTVSTDASYAAYLAANGTTAAAATTPPASAANTAAAAAVAAYYAAKGQTVPAVIAAGLLNGSISPAAVMPQQTATPVNPATAGAAGATPMRTIPTVGLTPPTHGSIPVATMPRR